MKKNENQRIPITVVQAVWVANQADRLFNRAARAWERKGCNNDLTDKYRTRAESMLEPLGIKTDYPGLYPSFLVNGHWEYSTLSAISAAWEEKR